MFLISASTVMAGGHKYKHAGWHGHHKQHHFYRHRGHNSHNGAYLVGGLILGSIIANNYHSHQSYRVVHHSTYREPVSRGQVVYSTRVIEPHHETAVTGRNLFRDLQGNCFEIHRSDEGDELKEQLPEEACYW
jgi:hypothetical protein